jgi:AcrR family transcriptional regulator
MHSRRSGCVQRSCNTRIVSVDYAVEYGFSELSWRPIAATLGITPTTLVHHFGSKTQMLQAILGRLRERMFLATSQQLGQQPDPATAARAVWKLAAAPRQAAEFRLFFAVYGQALQAPQQYAAFLDHVVSDWMSELIDAQRPNTDQATATRRVTFVIAVIRGLLLDLLATGDRHRVQDAAEAFLAELGYGTNNPKHRLRLTGQSHGSTTAADRSR